MQELSDPELKLAIDDLLSENPFIDSTGIEVTAELGFISLNGYVQDQEQRDLVVKTVSEHESVEDVFNYLSLRHKGIVGDDNLSHNVI